MSFFQDNLDEPVLENNRTPFYTNINTLVYTFAQKFK